MQKISVPCRLKNSKGTFYSQPFVIIRDQGVTAVIQDFFGLTKLVHKDNLRPCPEREYRLFDQLPLTAKQALGFPFTTEEILDAVQQGRVPEFWQESPSVPERPRTRSTTKALPEPVLAFVPFDSSDSESDDEPAPISKRVTFNV